MGCFPSSIAHIDAKYIFNSNEVHLLIQSCSIIRTNDPKKFAHDVLIKTTDLNSNLRQYWRTKIEVDGDNFDYGQHDSCLRTDKSWQLGLKEYSNYYLNIFEQLISNINNEKQFLIQLRTLLTQENQSFIEYQTLSIIHQAFMIVLRQRFKLLKYEFTDDYEKVWNKFFIFVIDYLIKQNSTELSPTDKV